MITLLYEQSERLCATASAAGEALWIGAQDMEAATGWALKPEGLCRDTHCIPVPPDHAADYVQAGRLNAAAFWRRLGHPVVHTATGDAWVLGVSAAERSGELGSPKAPDFALPDLAGATHTLSDLRGKRVLLATWASW
jgi:hypothetical protein